jgi:phospholipid/cholesterol/gamma-HCH transport system substrate-binding protein
MNEQTLRFRIGVFVLAALVLLAVLVVLFTGRPALFQRHDTFTVIFERAPGITPGTPVRRSGVRIGEVQNVQLDDATGEVRVTILIDQPHHLFKDDQLVLSHGALTGDTAIDVVSPPAAKPMPQRTEKQSGEIMPVDFQIVQAPPGQLPPDNQPPVRTPAAPGTVFRGASQADVAALLRELSSVTPSARLAFDEMTQALKDYQKLTPLLEENLREFRELAKVTRQTIPELRRTNDEIQVTARNWARLGERLDVLVQTNEDKMVKTLDNFNTTLTRVANTFSDENQRNLATMLRNVSAGSKNFESISRNTDALLRDSRETIHRVNDSVTEANKVVANLQQATQPLAERSPAIMKNLEEGSSKFNSTFTNVNQALSSFNQGDGTLQRFLSDPTLYQNLNEAACQITRTLPRVDRILKDMEVFADKIARHPESLGVGGAVRPSAGVKEAPTTTSFRPHFLDH